MKQKAGIKISAFLVQGDFKFAQKNIQAEFCAKSWEKC